MSFGPKSINQVISYLFSRREAVILQTCTTYTTVVRPYPTSNPTWGSTAGLWRRHSHLWRRNFQVKLSRVWNTEVRGREQEVTWAVESGLRKGSSASISFTYTLRLGSRKMNYLVLGKRNGAIEVSPKRMGQHEP